MPTRNTERPCPICGKPASFLAEPVGPFCSTRCQMVDLGQWFGEEYRISEPLRPEHFAPYENVDPDALPRDQEE